MWGTSLLNTNDKFKFSHEIVNNVNSLIVVANKKVRYCFQRNDYTYFRYSAAEVMGNGFGINGGFWIYSEEFHNDGIAERTFYLKTQVQKWRIQTHPVESQKYSNDLIIRSRCY
jgi:hypothetical protein